MPLLGAVSLVTFDVLLVFGLRGGITASFVDDVVRLGAPSLFAVSIMFSSIAFPSAAAASLYVLYHERSTAMNQVVYWHSVLVTAALLGVGNLYGLLGPAWTATLGLTPQIPRERTLDIVSNTLMSMISFIVPAHNEQAYLGRTLQAIHESARAFGQPYEIIVVDDASTDATAEIAQQNNARVVNVNHRQIAATRNSGGRAATGDRFFFVDADTRVNPRAINAAMRAMNKGAIGGGGPTWIDRNEPVPFYIRLIALLSIPAVKLIGFAGGAFMFCTREGFQASGGFSERMFWGEEISFALALKRHGRFVGLWQYVHTSGRRFRKTSALELFLGAIRIIVSPRKMVTERSAVEKIWYDSDRAGDDKMPDSFVAQISNGIALLLLIVTLTGPVWNFVSPSGPFGTLRWVCGTFLCHVGLIFWPFALLLFWNLFRRTYWLEWIKMAALVAFCVWQAWGATLGVIWFWPWLYDLCVT